MKDLLAEKYRPKNVDEYLFENERFKGKVTEWFNNNTIPNIFLYGPAGCGKSTIARIIVDHFIQNGTVQECDVKRIKASTNNGMDMVRSIEEMLSTSPFGEVFIIYLEEADKLSMDAQKALRTVTEDYSQFARFIMTANYPKNIIPAIRSRFQNFELGYAVDRDGFIDKGIEVMQAEDISIKEEDAFWSHVERCYPDFRSFLNSIDQATTSDADGSKFLDWPVVSDSSAGVEAWDEFWSSDETVFDADSVHGTLVDLAGAVDQINYESFYESMYMNAAKFGNHRSEAIIVISSMMDRAMGAASQRMRLEACLYLLLNEMEGGDE